MSDCVATQNEQCCAPHDCLSLAHWSDYDDRILVAIKPSIIYHPRMLIERPEFQNLQQHFEKVRDLHMRDLFAADTNRFARMSQEAAGIFIDYSKNRISDETLTLLMSLAKACQIETSRDQLFKGGHCNVSEESPALHTALRMPAHEKLMIEGENIIDKIQAVLAKMTQFVQRLHAGELKGHTGESITDVVNVGIGGSHLGSALAVEALSSFHRKKVNLHFIANIDGNEIKDVLAKLDLSRTVFLISSKSFSTLETITNATTLLNCYNDKKSALEHHFFAITKEMQRALEFGIPADNQFTIWDWVGGRFSLWSAIGLPIAVAIGMQNFREMLSGAHAMDRHFLHQPLASNCPIILAMLSIWYGNFFQFESHAVFPYYRHLRRLPSYLKQLEMESNGKSLDVDGHQLNYTTAPISWGEVGCNGQHSFHQFLHQGTQTTPCDFIIPLHAEHPYPEHHRLLIANCFSQSQALMQGKTADEMLEFALEKGYSKTKARRYARNAATPGNKPSNTILLNELTPHSLGALLALYEHKVFTESIIWHTNAFDQFGVELGKNLAAHLKNLLDDPERLNGLDCSTQGLVDKVRTATKSSHPQTK